MSAHAVSRPRSTARQRALDAIRRGILSCTQCPLHKTRTQAVPGVGPVDARVMFVGEAPGRQEDLSGEPFVGTAGRFLDELLQSVGLARRDVYITNVVKSRPYVGPAPGRNRPPTVEEIAACRSWLDEQIRIIQPEILVPMGRVALDHILPGRKISQVHGRPLRRGGRTVVPLFHPAAAVRRRALAKTLREDIQVLRSLLDAQHERPARVREERPLQPQKFNG